MHLENAVVILRFFSHELRFYKFLLFSSKSSRACWGQGILSFRFVPFHTEAVLQCHLRTTKKKDTCMRMYDRLRDSSVEKHRAVHVSLHSVASGSVVALWCADGQCQGPNKYACGCTVAGSFPCILGHTRREKPCWVCGGVATARQGILGQYI